ncbi:MAG TPA: toll/interleukin-1 receptor domain-containing protein [Thermoanaerobaculia bacterium]|nr:toll/interleukin-1 receptor domain-containing protein [Thermoanaerobaculia bacterium]
MADLFMSYAREDRVTAEALASLFEQSGWSVWWDRLILPRAGATFDEVIERELSISRCALVLWSSTSVTSAWVKAEASEALNQGKLIQAILNDVRPPLIFRSYQCASLVDWDGKPNSGDFPAIRAAVAHFAPGHNLLSIQEAESLILDLAQRRRAGVGPIEPAPVSPSGTASFRAKAMDGLGVIYCHASGALRGQAFYVRKGIGYYYEYLLGGSESSLGLPVSNEELVDGKGFPTSYFEHGCIDWSPKTAVARAVLRTTDGEVIIGEKRL